jgi:hypothetical protein
VESFFFNKQILSPPTAQHYVLIYRKETSLFYLSIRFLFFLSFVAKDEVMVDNV